MVEDKLSFPDLPKGYFFRVEFIPGWLLESYYELSIRKKRLFGSEKIVSRRVERYGPYETVIPTNDELNETADLLLLVDLEKSSNALERHNDIVGDYPPKKADGYYGS